MPANERAPDGARAIIEAASSLGERWVALEQSLEALHLAVESYRLALAVGQGEARLHSDLPARGTDFRGVA